MIKYKNYLIIFSLFIVSCASQPKTYGLNSFQESDKMYKAVTEMRPIVRGLFTKSRLKDMASFYSLGKYSPHQLDFYAYSDDLEEAKNIAKKNCLSFLKENNWENKADCAFTNVYKNPSATKASIAVISSPSKSELIAAAEQKALKNCLDIGLLAGSKEYDDCKFKLSSIYKKGIIDNEKN